MKRMLMICALAICGSVVQAADSCASSVAMDPDPENCITTNVDLQLLLEKVTEAKKVREHLIKSGMGSVLARDLIQSFDVLDKALVTSVNERGLQGTLVRVKLDPGSLSDFKSCIEALSQNNRNLSKGKVFLAVCCVCVLLPLFVCSIIALAELWCSHEPCLTAVVMGLIGSLIFSCLSCCGCCILDFSIVNFEHEVFRDLHTFLLSGREMHAEDLA